MLGKVAFGGSSCRGHRPASDARSWLVTWQGLAASPLAARRSAPLAPRAKMTWRLATIGLEPEWRRSDIILSLSTRRGLSEIGPEPKGRRRRCGATHAITYSKNAPRRTGPETDAPEACTIVLQVRDVSVLSRSNFRETFPLNFSISRPDMSSSNKNPKSCPPVCPNMSAWAPGPKQHAHT